MSEQDVIYSGLPPGWWKRSLALGAPDPGTSVSSYNIMAPGGAALTLQAVSEVCGFGMCDTKSVQMKREAKETDLQVLFRNQ